MVQAVLVPGGPAGAGHGMVCRAMDGGGQTAGPYRWPWRGPLPQDVKAEAGPAHRGEGNGAEAEVEWVMEVREWGGGVIYGLRGVGNLLS